MLGDAREVVEGRWRRGIFFAEDSWDGSDLFAAEGEGAGWPYVSERARDALLGAGLRGLDFEPLPELKYWD